ncbi:DNA damage-regulated autophagy modulator protein 2-like isoform X2 [Lithobates pipiens]
MEVQDLEFLPILMAVWTFCGFIILYVLTILNGHAESYFLYISETGDYFPESVLFMVVFAVSAVLDAILSYCMYRYYAMKSSKSQHCYPHLQYAILGLGWIACVGTVIVAIFPITGKIAIITEWIGAIGILVYKLTHCADFQHLAFKWHCSCRENWLFLRKTQQEIWNNSDWRVARKNRFLKILPLPPWFYAKIGPYCSEEQENNVKLAHQNLLEGCSS